MRREPMDEARLLRVPGRDDQRRRGRQRAASLISSRQLRESELAGKDPNRYWWVSLVLVFGTALGFWFFQQRMFPTSDGVLGAVVGYLMGSFLAALFEDYIDQSAK